jgi:hypothetical protein
MFHNNETNVETVVDQQETGSFLIDSDDDGYWDVLFTNGIGVQVYTGEVEHVVSDSMFDMMIGSFGSAMFICLSVLSILIVLYVVIKQRVKRT